MRKVKKHHERKKEYLEAARKLFFTKGYEQTPVEAIIKEVGLSKGSFYYYFKSKKDLLDELTKELSLQIITKIEEIVGRDDLDAISKLNKSFSEAAAIKFENIQLIKTLLKVLCDEKNVYFRYKIYQKNTDIIAPEFYKIVQQGIKEEIFNTPYPLESSRMIFELANALTERIAKLILEVNEKPENFQKLQREYDNYQLAIERILGTKEGAINFINDNLLKSFIDKITC
ncbi:MAG: TetR/AcrR family transcriptional regulator [Atribacterota bacterium]|nr:TetR/AcrR family transcriptional regulator [Atribacterota bacterium]MDD4895395.1 TetR/AcrR family transcriptional regulator [Atribacterota bacterium]MDD5637956.1 TetR/AcrR family transcriptional regulator [Atribacterota bacterium]